MFNNFERCPSCGADLLDGSQCPQCLRIDLLTQTCDNDQSQMIEFLQLIAHYDRLIAQAKRTVEACDIRIAGLKAKVADQQAQINALLSRK